MGELKRPRTTSSSQLGFDFESTSTVPAGNPTDQCASFGAQSPSAPLDVNVSPRKHACPQELADELREFREFGKKTVCATVSYRAENDGKREVPVFVNEFWTARQRQAHSLHEVSYRACFKPQLPRFFIERVTKPGDIVYDPFMGRGTTLLEAALHNRIPYGCDINPLSQVLAGARLKPPTLEQIAARLETIDFANPSASHHNGASTSTDDLLVFYHPETLKAISSLRHYLLEQRRKGELDRVDEWICMVAINRLTGHSTGFFSVYTLPPNQAVSAKSQRKINTDRNQEPPPRNVPKLLFRKSKQLLGDCTAQELAQLHQLSERALLLTRPAAATPEIPRNSVALVVTSPPFLNVVDYATDNWLRCWFLGIDPKTVALTVPRKLEDWEAAMTQVFHELHRVLKPGGYIAFEVGEVHGGATKLEEAVVPCGCHAGLEPLLVLINDQEFTKTANCWGVDNMSKGTNTNRIVVFRKRE